MDHETLIFVHNKTLGFPPLVAGHFSPILGMILLDQVTPKQEANFPLLAN